jgi:hypothetical protein
LFGLGADQSTVDKSHKLLNQLPKFASDGESGKTCIQRTPQMNDRGKESLFALHGTK